MNFDKNNIQQRWTGREEKGYFNGTNKEEPNEKGNILRGGEGRVRSRREVGKGRGASTELSCQHAIV